MFNKTSVKLIFGFLTILAIGVLGLLATGYFDAYKTSVPASNSIIQK